MRGGMKQRNEERPATKNEHMAPGKAYVNVNVRVRVRERVHARMCPSVHPSMAIQSNGDSMRLMAWKVIVSFRTIDARDNGDISQTSPLDWKRRVGPTVNDRIYCFY